MIRIRKQAVNMEGEERSIVVIRDITEVICHEKQIERESQDKMRKKLVYAQLNKVFLTQTYIVGSLHKSNEMLVDQ